MTSVAVIIPTLNEANHIADLLSLIQAQDYSGPIETIVVDGGSSDNTVEIVHRFPSVTLIESQKGVSKQRNAGASVASQELLFFFDADTKPSKGFVSAMVRRYEASRFAAACPWFLPDTWRPDIHLIFATLNTLFFLSQLRFHAGAGVCIVTPKAIFDRLNGFDQSLHFGEDVDYLQRAAVKGPHRHLFIPLLTSARRFETQGSINTALLYARISPALLLGNKEKLRSITYSPVPRPGCPEVKND